MGEVSGGEPVRERKWKRTARNDRHCGTGRLCCNANAGTDTVHTHTHYCFFRGLSWTSSFSILAVPMSVFVTSSLCLVFVFRL